jgi:hypothetical protein
MQKGGAAGDQQPHTLRPQQGDGKRRRRQVDDDQVGGEAA